MLLAAAAGAVVLVIDTTRVLEVRSVRAGGFLILGPATFVTFGVLTAERGVRAIRPWVEYVRRTDIAQRRVDRARDLVGQRRWPLAFFGGAALLGQIALLVFVRQVSSQTAGLVLDEVHLLLGLLWIAALGLLTQTVWYARFLPSGEPPPDSEGRHRG